jgi:hypothetical protein
VSEKVRVGKLWAGLRTGKIYADVTFSMYTSLYLFSCMTVNM